MTVAELIEKLSEFPPDMPVMVTDYEDGSSLATQVIVMDYPPPLHVEVS